MTDNSTVIRSAGAIGASPLGKRNPIWTPDLMPGLVESWEVDDGITLSAGEVVTWEGLQGNILTGGAGARPAQTGSMNGKTPVLITGNDYLQFGAVTIGAIKGFAFMLNIATLTPGTRQDLMIPGAGSGGVSLIMNTTGNRIQCYVASGNAITSSSQVPTGDALIVVVKGMGDSKYHIRVNGAEVATPATLTGEAANFGGTGRIGQATNAGQPVLNSSIGAAAWFEGVQEATDIYKLEGYLAQKYSGPALLPGAHPYQSVAPRKLT